MQEGDVGASNSDLQTDRADDNITHMPDRCVQKMAPCFQHETCKELSQRESILSILFSVDHPYFALVCFVCWHLYYFIFEVVLFFSLFLFFGG